MKLTTLTHQPLTTVCDVADYAAWFSYSDTWHAPQIVLSWPVRSGLCLRSMHCEHCGPAHLRKQRILLSRNTSGRTQSLQPRRWEIVLARNRLQQPYAYDLHWCHRRYYYALRHLWLGRTASPQLYLCGVAIQENLVCDRYDTMKHCIARTAQDKMKYHQLSDTFTASSCRVVYMFSRINYCISFPLSR